uniref:DUF7144 family membrane protein n=1 Tax=Peterkaempfera griseoplana TaxID=66896 RepID=UPI0006E39E9B
MSAPSNGMRRHSPSRDTGWVEGPHVFGGLALELSGTLSILMGAAGIAQSNIWAHSQYVYRFDLTAWGWIHALIGIGLVVAGVGVLAGLRWGRGVGIALAAVSLVTQFMF